MTQSNRGTRRLFPSHRSTVLDILSQSIHVPSFPVLRRINVADIAKARSRCCTRIGWTTLFGRAYALVCQDLPELRDLFVSYPTPYLYRHPHSVCSMSIHRRDGQGRERLIWGRWTNPESETLNALQESLDQICTAPLEEVYREGLILERFPRWMRRISWWSTMRWMGRKRAKHIGTFSISSLGGQGALNLHHPLVTSSSLAFGPIDASGEMDIVLICDHRAIDGALAASALENLERKLQQEIMGELQSIRSEVSRAA